MNFHVNTIRGSAQADLAKTCPAALAHILDLFPSIEVLSLDCFDTVIWRHAYRPFDVFYAAAGRPAFRSIGLSARSRRAAEQTARTLHRVRCGRREVGILDIYRAALPSLSEGELHQLAEHELGAECGLAFAHPGAVELLRRARNRGVPVTIVSDTYFDEARLRRLLEHVLPADAYAAIARVVCSSEHGISKAEGLFELAYPEGEFRRDVILHVGDNESADYRAAIQAGLKAIHLVQFRSDEIVREAMRASTLSVLDPAVRESSPLQAPYRGPLSTWRSKDGEGKLHFGAEVLGPIFHAFGRWMAHERQALVRHGADVKFVFLLRDGHLPFLVDQALNASQGCFRASISRFTAFAASFRSLEDIDRYLARFAATRRFEALARQLLLPNDIAAKIVRRASAAADPVASFCESVRRPKIVSGILDASARFRGRMRRYLEREIALKQGDSVVFVDVGYLGTTQRVLQPVFEDEWGAKLSGRYLLFSGAASAVSRGMLDASCCDERAIDALVPYLSLVDNLCSCPGGSVEDYTEDGSAVLGPQLVEPTQLREVERLQGECVEFVRHAEAFFASCRQPIELDVLRKAALGELGRLIFFPVKTELDLLDGFQGEVNLGTEDRRLLFDRNAGLDGLRQRGLNFVERNAAMRPHYPAELRAAGLELSITLLAQQRYALEIPVADWSYRDEQIDTLVVRGDQSFRQTMRAVATHDGYFAAILPIGDGSFHLGLRFGERYKWMQMHSAEIVPVSRLMGDTESLHRNDVLSTLILDGIRDHGQGLWECEEGSLMMIPAGTWSLEEPAACRLVFRPIVRRQE